MAVVDVMITRVHQRLPPDDMLLPTCPKCQHTFLLPSSCCAQSPLVVSATLHLPPAAPSCTMTVTARRCQVGMSGGGIVQDSRTDLQSVILQKAITSSSGSELTVNLCPPELSPSSPIAFVIPPSPSLKSTPSQHHLQGSDLERLSATVDALQRSGWFYEGLSWQESAALLMSSTPGTFLVRNSSDPRFLFSLSVQTDRGPTSVRLHYHHGHFRLDATPKLVPFMPVFPCVVRLVEYYVAVTNQRDKPRGKERRWVDCKGQTYSSILLTKPLYQRGRFPDLKHLARLAVNSLAEHVPRGELPGSLHQYLADYPFSL